MSTAKVIMLANHCSDAMLWSPKDMLIDCIKECSGDYAHIKKAIVIYYDEQNPDNRKRIMWSQAGMKRSEILNLLSLARDDLLLNMFDELAGD